MKRESAIDLRVLKVNCAAERCRLAERQGQRVGGLGGHDSQIVIVMPMSFFAFG